MLLRVIRNQLRSPYTKPLCSSYRYIVIIITHLSGRWRLQVRGHVRLHHATAQRVRNEHGRGVGVFERRRRRMVVMVVQAPVLQVVGVADPKVGAGRRTRHRRVTKNFGGRFRTGNRRKRKMEAGCDNLDESSG